MKIYSLFLLLLPSFLSFAQTTENDAEQLKKTKVLSITIMGASLDEFGNANAIRTKKEYRKYSTSGLLSQEIIYDVQSAIVSNTNFLYNKDNQISKFLTKDGAGNVIKKQQCSYKNGLKTSCEGLEKDHSYELTYSYDTEGNQTERKKTLENGAVKFHCFAEYEEKNIITESCDGEPKIKIDYQYDSTGVLIAKNTFSNESLSFRFTYAYNERGQLIEEVKYNAAGTLIEKFVYEYIDEKLTKSISKYNQNNRLAMFWKYFYDSKSNIEFIKIYEGEKKTPLYQSEYLYKYY